MKKILSFCVEDISLTGDLIGRNRLQSVEIRKWARGIKVVFLNGEDGRALLIAKCCCKICLHEWNSDPGLASANITVHECLHELRQKSTAVLLSLWILSMALGNLGLDEFWDFNQGFNLMPAIEQKFTLIQIAKINKLFLHVSYKTTALEELY